jgi:hypothetical protein
VLLDLIVAVWLSIAVIAIGVCRSSARRDAWERAPAESADDLQG